METGWPGKININIPESAQAMSSLTMLDWFATFAPEPTESEISVERSHDLNRARNNERYVARNDLQIRCELRYKYAREMMKTRG